MYNTLGYIFLKQSRHPLANLTQKIEGDITILQQNLRINEEFSFELLHCIIFTLSTQQELLLDNEFSTSESRIAWENNFARYLRGNRNYMHILHCSDHISEQQQTTLNEVHRQVLQRIDQDTGVKSLIMEEIRGNYDPPDTAENIPKILAATDPGLLILEEFVNFMAAPERIQNYPILHTLFFRLVLDDLKILRYFYRYYCLCVDSYFTTVISLK